MTCHLINKAFMKQNCIEKEKLEMKAALSSFT